VLEEHNIWVIKHLHDLKLSVFVSLVLQYFFDSNSFSSFKAFRLHFYKWTLDEIYNILRK
jgi:Cdc6-like AAA superfamily ATPase